MIEKDVPFGPKIVHVVSIKRIQNDFGRNGYEITFIHDSSLSFSYDIAGGTPMGGGGSGGGVDGEPMKIVESYMGAVPTGVLSVQLKGQGTESIQGRRTRWQLRQHHRRQPLPLPRRQRHQQRPAGAGGRRLDRRLQHQRRHQLLFAAGGRHRGPDGLAAAGADARAGAQHAAGHGAAVPEQRRRQRPRRPDAGGAVPRAGPRRGAVAVLLHHRSVRRRHGRRRCRSGCGDRGHAAARFSAAAASGRRRRRPRFGALGRRGGAGDGGAPARPPRRPRSTAPRKA